MESSNDSGNKSDKSPTKQRTLRQLPGEKNVGIYFAQTKKTIDSSYIVTDTSDSDDDDNDAEGSDNYIIAENGSLKKRKERDCDPIDKKCKKIRKNFDSNITFVDEDIENSLGTESQKTTSSETELPRKILQDSLSSNIELTIKDKSTSSNNTNKSGNTSDTQATDTLEGLDDLFEEDWTYKKDTVEVLDDFFQDEWDGDKEADFDEPQRCVIIDIVWEKSDITMTVKTSNSEATSIVKCLGIWRYTKIEPGQSIVIKAKKESPDSKHWVVDNNFGWVVSQPDSLIAGTSVVGALWCNRRSVFQEKFRQIENLPYNNVGNNYMLTGSLTHELLQTVLDRNITDIREISTLLDDILKSKHAVRMMYSAGISMGDCKNLMRPSIVQIHKFLRRYIMGIQPDVPDQNFDGKIEKIHDIEENVWLPNLGMKGKIDLTVEVSSKPKNKMFSVTERRILPLELKTGKSSFSNEHQGQLILYTMMMNMTNRPTDSGLLYYLRENIMKEIKGSAHAQRDLIMLRNTVAYYSTRQPVVVKVQEEEKLLQMELPKPINHRTCQQCPYNVLCSTYLTEEDKKELFDSHHLKTISETVTTHLSQEHIDYVKKWVSLMQLEEITENKDLSSWQDVWTYKPSKREKRGSCISNLSLISVSTKDGRYVHEFQRVKTSNEEVSEINLTDFSEDEYVIISTNNRVNICSGFIYNLTSDSVSVHCEKDITKVYKDKVFHLDKCSSSNFLVHNLSQLGGLLDDHEICTRLRKIVIDRRPATFETELPDSAMKAGVEILDRLNEKQRQAILQALKADNYVLIKGFPGTGKTQTLVAMVEYLVKLDKSVLVTAHTNSALDNILLKLLDHNIDFIRLGSTTKANPKLLQKTDDVVTKHCDSPESLHTVYCSKKIVGVTCYGTTHTHIAKRNFDYCIIDESTQVLQPTILRPLYCASKFVLVGDPEQLPPIARNNTARKLGINVSLFSRLDSENNSVALTLQYRMNSCIMDIANKLTYHNQLQVGNEEIGRATIPVKNIAIFESCEKWVRRTLSLRLKNSAILLNTSATYHLTLDSAMGEAKGACNYWEASIIIKLVEVLKKLGIDHQEIGIVAPYRAQVRLLRSFISNDIEVNTVDQYQGRDKSVILYSCTKSISMDTDIHEFNIMEDHQRLTVAVTRAKHKLIIVGDLNTLQRFTPFSKLIEAFKSHERVYDLKDGEDDFCFDDLMKTFL